MFTCISGTVSISATLVTSPLGPYIRKFLPKPIRNATIFKRYLALSLLNLTFTSLMALVHVADDLNSGQYVIFGMIALLRGFQGFIIGIMYVFVQVRSVYYLLRRLLKVFIENLSLGLN